MKISHVCSIFMYKLSYSFSSSQVFKKQFENLEKILLALSCKNVTEHLLHWNLMRVPSLEFNACTVQHSHTCVIWYSPTIAKIQYSLGSISFDLWKYVYPYIQLADRIIARVLWNSSKNMHRAVLLLSQQQQKIIASS